jgi:hypothetical protein
VEDFFETVDNEADQDASYPAPLFACTDAQAAYVTRAGVSREIIFDGVLRSTFTCGYDTHIVPSKPMKKKIVGTGPRQQLKPCKVTSLPSLFYNNIFLPILNGPSKCRRTRMKWISINIKCGSY